jgi:ketosteroid isomerase-like protein
MVIEDQPAWSPHLRSRAILRTSPKRHFVDPSLAVAALAGEVWQSPGCSPVAAGRGEGREGDGMTVEANKQVVERFFDALARRDWDAMTGLMTDDCHYTDVGSPGPGGTGPDGVMRRLRLGIEPLAGYEHLPGTNVVGEGDLVMTEHTERWTFHTGEVIDHSFVSVTELRDGKIRR